MSLQALKNINRTTAPPSEKPKNFPAMLEQFKGEIARALPKHINPERMARIALTAFRTTPKLADCDPRSVFAAVIQSSQMGLEVGLMGEARLVPFGTQCQLIPGYTGLMKLARQSGLVQDIYAHEVRLKDTFSLKLGLERDLRHEPLTAEGGFPASDEERGEIAGFYAVAVFKDGSRTFVAMGRKEVEKIRDGSRGYQAAKKYKKESIWDSDFGSVGLKTAIRRICKFLPKSPELAAALALDAAADLGKDQNLNLNEVIEGNYTPIIDDETGEIKESGTGAPDDKSTQSTGQDAEPKGATAVDTGNGASGAAAESGKQEPRSSTNGKLDAVIAKMKSVTTIDALDEVYIRAEGDLNTAELDEAMKYYGVRKADLGSLI